MGRKRGNLDFHTNALFLAIDLGSVEKLKLLIKRGVKFECKTPKTDLTPLMFACWKGNLEIIKSLVEAGLAFDPNEKNNIGKTALDYWNDEPPSQPSWFVSGNEKAKAKQFSLSTLAYLYNAAKCTVSSSFGRLLLKCLSGNEADEQLLAGLLLDEPEAGNESLAPLMLAAKESNFRVVERLIKAGAELKKKDAYGMSTFVYVAECEATLEQFHAILSRIQFTLDDFKNYLRLGKKKTLCKIHAMVKVNSELKIVFEDYYRTRPDHFELLELLQRGDWKILTAHFKEYLTPFFLVDQKAFADYVCLIDRDPLEMPKVMNYLKGAGLHDMT